MVSDTKCVRVCVEKMTLADSGVRTNEVSKYLCQQRDCPVILTSRTLKCESISVNKMTVGDSCVRNIILNFSVKVFVS